MTLPQCVSDSNNSTTPNSVLTVFLFCIAGIFSVELALVDARSGWWLDDLSSLWASDPNLPFRLVFGERILSDSNPPLYFSLLYCVRQIVSDDGAAVVAVNAGASAPPRPRSLSYRGAPELAGWRSRASPPLR